jgi:hypothetical protein
MSDADESRVPRHPDVDRRSLVVWPGYRSGLSIDQLNRTVVGAIAKPLSHAVQDPALIAGALQEGMGVVLPAQAWRNQLPLDHPKRAGTFSALALHRPGLELAPDDAPFAPAFAEAYAADHVAAELQAGATIATTPGHVLARERAVGRENDLQLARLAAGEFVARGASAPAPGQPVSARRAIYATIVLQGAHAKKAETIDWLVTRYAALEDVSGYWIVAANCNGSGVQLAGYARLALRLQAATGRPAVVSCVGDAHLALLASGVAATCAGLHGMSFTYPPALLPVREDGEQEPLGIFVYHRSVLGFVGQLGAKGEPARAAIFRNLPCPCGHHSADRPPEGKREIVAHNSWAVSADASEFAGPPVLAAEDQMARRTEDARRQRRFLQLSALKPGFVAVPRAAAALRADEARRAAGE